MPVTAPQGYFITTDEPPYKTYLVQAVDYWASGTGHTRESAEQSLIDTIRREDKLHENRAAYLKRKKRLCKPNGEVEVAI